MGKKTINLNSIINANIHRPKTNSGYTLYPKVKDYKGNMENEQATKAEQDPTYQRQSVKTFSSPTNIRRLFITGAHIRIDYYTAPIINGKSADRTTAVSISNKSGIGMSLFDVAEKIAMYSQDRARYMGEKAINKNAEEPTQYNVTGTFNMAAYPYTCSNIEEIYFDWTLLLSTEISPYFKDLLTTGQGTIATPEQIAQQFLTFNSQQIVESQLTVQMFSAFNAGGAKNLRKRFPRLREITFISNLDKLLESQNIIGNTKKYYDSNAINNGKSIKTWFELNENIIRSTPTYVIRGITDKSLPNPNKEFIVKSNMYKFDFEKLDGYVRTYKDKIEKARREALYGNANTSGKLESNTDDIIEMCDLEKRLLEIEQKYGTKIMNNVWINAYNGSSLGKTEFEKVLKQFTKPNRSRIANVINIRL